MEALQPLEETMEELGGGDFLEVFDDHFGHELSSSSLNVIIIMIKMVIIIISLDWGLLFVHDCTSSYKNNAHHGVNIFILGCFDDLHNDNDELGQ